ncbi:type IV secretory system conjugative DNA transfer family protein, partial [Ruminococcus sp. AM27-11LB]
MFVIISDTDDTFNFIVSIMYTQLFNLLCDRADDVYNGRLPIHVRCLLDEFANSVTRSTPKTVGITDKSV